MRWGPAGLAGHLEDGHPPPVGGGDNGKEATTWGPAAWAGAGGGGGRTGTIRGEKELPLPLTLDNSC